MLPDLIIIIVLIILSALFSGTETAYTSLTWYQVKELETGKRRSGKLAAKLAGQPDILLTTILIGNNLVNIAASSLTTTMTIRVFGNFAVGIATGILTLIVLVFAEITPKQIALIHNDSIARIMAYPIKVLTYILFPVVKVVNRMSVTITKLTSRKNSKKISLEGILHVVDIAQDQGIVEDYETRLVQKVFRFDNTDVHTIMTHRTDVFSVPETATVSEVLGDILASGYSRIPVFSESAEDVTGVLLVKDLFKELQENKAETTLVKELAKEPIFVPETRKVHEMFFLFKKSNLHLAVVLDEYGGLAGIVTLEDVIEELFGELYDEHETGAQERLTHLPDGSFRILGETSIHQFEDSFNIRIEHSRHVGTIGGYLTEILGKIPQPHQEINAELGKFTIEAMRGNRIETVIFYPNSKDS